MTLLLKSFDLALIKLINQITRRLENRVGRVSPGLPIIYKPNLFLRVSDSQ